MVATISHADPGSVMADEWRPDVPSGLAPGDERFVAAAERAAARLPDSVAGLLSEMSERAPQAGAALVRGLPVGNLPATPHSPRHRADKDHVSELVLLAIARRLGQPVGYAPEHGGDLVQNIVPTKTSVSRQTSTSSHASS